MPLLEIYKSNPAIVADMGIQQLVNIAGDGNLSDESQCSFELRSFFRGQETERLKSYIESSLQTPFEKSGFVLQELVNELGSRLEYSVEHGLYQGRRNSIGYDGLWHIEKNISLIVEIKTTDAYRINLDTLAKYRKKLNQEGRLNTTNATLIVVGRQDTGDLESQIRGSRYAWDMRLLSVEALLKLVLLKENTDEPETLQKIQSLLMPVEYTRLDNLIDIIFTAAKDIDNSDEALPDKGVEETPNSVREKKTFDFSHRAQIEQYRQAALHAFNEKFKTKLIPKSRAMFGDEQASIRVCCSGSKLHNSGNLNQYWYAYHPRWQTYLEQAADGFMIYCCIGHQYAYAVPAEVLEAQLKDCYVTQLGKENFYWHIELVPEGEAMYLLLRKTGKKIPLTPYRLELKQVSA